MDALEARIQAEHASKASEEAGDKARQLDLAAAAVTAIASHADKYSHLLDEIEALHGDRVTVGALGEAALTVGHYAEQERDISDDLAERVVALEQSVPRQ